MEYQLSIIIIILLLLLCYNNNDNNNTDGDAGSGTGDGSDNGFIIGSNNDTTNTGNDGSSSSSNDNNNNGGTISSSGGGDSSSISNNNNDGGSNNDTGSDNGNGSIGGNSSSIGGNSSSNNNDGTSIGDGNDSGGSSSNNVGTNSNIIGNYASSYTSIQEREQLILQKCTGQTLLTRSRSLLRLLGNFVANPEEQLARQVGPHYDAFVWLAYFDDAVLCPLQVVSVSDPEDEDEGASRKEGEGLEDVDVALGKQQEKRILQRYTLATMYYSLNGDQWNNCPSEWRFEESSEIGECKEEEGGGGGGSAVRFLDARHECEWFGIECDLDGIETTGALDVNAYLPVTNISLPSNNLQGELPIEFYEAFELLQVWNMEDNELRGTLSQDVGNLGQLEVLKLNENQLIGDIPFDALSRLQHLETINLGGNDLSGNANELCNIFSDANYQPKSFEIDCVQKVDCSCCTKCT